DEEESYYYSSYPRSSSSQKTGKGGGGGLSVIPGGDAFSSRVLKSDREKKEGRSSALSSGGTGLSSSCS
ncbi:hypothetical protein CSUI_008396, partial [Cystoisospora suis]